MADSIAEYSRAVRDWFKDGLAKGLGGLLKGVLYQAVADAEDVAAIADAAKGGFDIAATGVQIGDFCLCVAPSLAAGAVSGVFYTAQVSAANVITVSIFNKTGGALDLAAQNFYVLVIPRV